MDYKNRLLEKLNLPPRGKLKEHPNGEPFDITQMMMDPRYLRQSSALIHEALQKGFDVLQMEDGDIVMTGTKTIVYRYEWDSEKGRLMRVEMPESPEEAARQSISEPEEA